MKFKLGPHSIPIFSVIVIIGLLSACRNSARRAASAPMASPPPSFTGKARPPNSNWETDYPRVAWDANGVYVTAVGVDFNRSAGTASVVSNFIFGFQKPDVYTSTAPKPPFQFYMFAPSAPNIAHNHFALQPVINFNATPSGGYAWILSKNPPSGVGSSYQHAVLRCTRVWWSGSTFNKDIGGTSISDCAGTKKYFDFDPAWDPTDTKGPPNFDPHLPGVRRTKVPLGSRPQHTFIRGHYLWTCQNAGLDGTDGDFDGNASGTDLAQTASTIDRTGIRWVKLQIATTGNSVTCADTDILFHSASSNPYWYYCPSIMVNSAGHMLLGFSLTRETEFIGAAYAGRSSAGVYERVVLAQAGRNFYGRPDRRAWGDYSRLSLDPSDNATLWGIQTFADEDEFWALWITSLRITPP